MEKRTVADFLRCERPKDHVKIFEVEAGTIVYEGDAEYIPWHMGEYNLILAAQCDMEKRDDYLIMIAEA